MMIQKIILLVTGFLFLAITSSFGQDDFEWGNIAFTLEEDFEIIKNGRKKFEAAGGGLEILVLPFEDDGIDEDDITDFTAHIAINMDLEEIDAAQEINLNGLEGAYVEGYKDGDRVFLLGMINPDSNDNFIAIVTFDDDDSDAEEEALDILSSFRAID